MSDKIRKNILFNKGRDKDILDWLETQENQSKEVRNALRFYMVHKQIILSEPSLIDVLDEISRLSQKLDGIKLIESNEVVEKELPDLVAKLRNFGV